MPSTCKMTYYNYGSYLRSRGVDQTVCGLNNKILENTNEIDKLKKEVEQLKKEITNLKNGS